MRRPSAPARLRCLRDGGFRADPARCGVLVIGRLGFNQRALACRLRGRFERHVA